MINLKTNIAFKFFVLTFIWLCFYACKNREEIIFENKLITTDTLFDCRVIDCAAIELNLVNVLGEDEIALKINKEIERAAATIFDIDHKNLSNHSLDKAAEQFNSSYQKILEEFPDETSMYEANVNCKLSFQCQDIISLAMDSYIFTGGAHGNSTISYINIDPVTGKKLSLRALLNDVDAFKKYVENAFRKAHKIDKNQSINSTGFFFENDTFTLPSTIGFTDKEVILYYNPYEISSYAEGPVELKLNKKDVVSYFTVSIF